jgi:[acyl-carrier-protein] S-malonyltransferase
MSEKQPFAIVFPGQGSQAVGMLAGLAGDYPQVQQAFAEASEKLGFDLWRLSQQGPEQELNRTERTQPALLAAGVAVWRCWNEAGGDAPALMAGHSLGEYTALVCAGVIDFADAVTLVAERGRLMQAAVPEGGGRMAAILGLEDGRVEQLCGEAAGGEVVSVANYNSPGQAVIAGASAAVERAVGLAREAGAKRALPLPVSVPSHCALMRDAAAEFAGTLAAVPFRDGGIPVIQNTDAGVRVDAGAIKEELVRQLHQPVQWVRCVNAIRAEGIDQVIESGPGKVLAGLIKRIDRDIRVQSIIDTDTLQQALQGREA